MFICSNKYFDFDFDVRRTFAFDVMLIVERVDILDGALFLVEKSTEKARIVGGFFPPLLLRNRIEKFIDNKHKSYTNYKCLSKLPEINDNTFYT